jgi:hypothetical protein
LRDQTALPLVTIHPSVNLLPSSTLNAIKPEMLDKDSEN